MWEAAAAAAFFLIFSVRLLCIFINLPEANECDEILGIPRNPSYLLILKDLQIKFISGYKFSGYHIFVTLVGAIFPIIEGVILVVFSATSGASLWYFLSKFDRHGFGLLDMTGKV